MENIFKEEKAIISEYLDADFNDRIIMFLQYRELRPNFTEIDQVEKYPHTHYVKNLQGQIISDRTRDQAK